jgi:hypothetical protein
MLYVGVDAHRETSQITVMNEAGQVVKRERVSSSLEGIREALGGYGQPLKAVLEASYSWGPMYDWLDEVVEEVVLAHPGKVRAIAEARTKTDKIDLEILAHLLRADLIPKAYAPSKDVRAVKRVLRQRMSLVRVGGRMAALGRAMASAEPPLLPFAFHGTSGSQAAAASCAPGHPRPNADMAVPSSPSWGTLRPLQVERKRSPDAHPLTNAFSTRCVTGSEHDCCVDGTRLPEPTT